MSNFQSHGILKSLHLLLYTTSQEGGYYYPSFMDNKDAEKLSDIPKVIVLLSFLML
jgi:hypothetical protein